MSSILGRIASTGMPVHHKGVAMVAIIVFAASLSPPA
jgi:hypothetical protein